MSNIDTEILDIEQATENKQIVAGSILANMQVPTITSTNQSILITKSVNEWLEDAMNKPIPNMLFGQLWFEGELCILYASSNVGKSILAVQVGDSISSGRNVYPLRFEAQAQPVLYFDAELSAKQFENRYSNNYQNHHVFSSNFFRVEINHEADVPKDVSQEINMAIEKEIVGTGAKILIVDNITYLNNETEKSKDAIPLMKHLKKLKAKYGLSILALAHTPKRDQSRPINRNDLSGSSMIMNFCDSAFAIGESNRDKSLRYIKQIKSRNCDLIYSSENVLVYEVQKPDNFVHFDFVDYGDEQQHLISHSVQEKEDKKQQAITLKESGKTVREIADELGIGKSTVSRWLKSAN